MSSGSDRRLRSQGNPEIGQASNPQRSRTTPVDKNLPRVASLPSKPPATPTGVGILFNPIPMNQGKPSDTQEASSRPIMGPSEVPDPTLSTEATGLVTQPPITTTSPLARDDNEVRNKLITRVAEQAAVAKVSELCPRLVTRHINEIEQNASAIAAAHIETKFEAWKSEVVGEVQRFMNVEIPRHLKEISDEVDLLRSSSLLAGTQVDALQKSSLHMESRLTMLTKHGVFSTLVEDAPPGTKSKLARRQSKSSVHRNSKHRHTDDTDSSSSEEEPIGSGSFSDSEFEVRRTSKRNSSHSTRNRAVSSSRRSFPGLEELLPANSKFKKVLSYKTYHLDEKSQSEDANVRKRLGKLVRIFNVSLGDHKFDGSDPISVLAFLANFFEECNNNAVPEGAAKLLLKHFLRGRARDAFISTLNVGSEGSSQGLRSYTESVQWLLRNYAKDTYIHDAVTELRDLTQKEHETEQEFGNRLAQKYS